MPFSSDGGKAIRGSRSLTECEKPEGRSPSATEEKEKSDDVRSSLFSLGNGGRT
jgi:hypothetical protein